MPLAERKEPPPWGRCEVCGFTARVWKANERIVALGAGYAVVEGEGYCRECIALAVELAGAEDD
jgi:hypothetical protein